MDASAADKLIHKPTDDRYLFVYYNIVRSTTIIIAVLRMYTRMQ